MEREQVVNENDELVVQHEKKESMVDGGEGSRLSKKKELMVDGVGCLQKWCNKCSTKMVRQVFKIKTKFSVFNIKIG